MCWSKNAGVAGYAEAFRPVQSDSQTSEWYSYFENDVLGIWRSTCRSSTWFQTWNYRNTGLRSVRSHRTSDRRNHRWFTVAFCRRFHEHSGNRSIFLNCIYPKRHCDHSSRSPDRDSDQKRNQQCRKPLITVSSQRIAR